MTSREFYDLEFWAAGVLCLFGAALIVGFRPGSPPWQIRALHLTALSVFLLKRAAFGSGGGEWLGTAPLGFVVIVTVALIVGLARSVNQTERTRRQIEHSAVVREIRAVEREDRSVEREDRAVEREERAVERDRGAIVRDDEAIVREESAIIRDDEAIVREESAVDRDERDR